MEADPKEELDRITKGGTSSDVTGDPEEVALKFLGVAVLYGIRENAKRLSFVTNQQGGSQLNVEGAGKYKLPVPPAAITDQIFKVMRSITHLEGGRGKEPLSLGIRNDRLELDVEFDSAGDRQTLTLTFPEL